MSKGTTGVVQIHIGTTIEALKPMGEARGMSIAQVWGLQTEVILHGAGAIMTMMGLAIHMTQIHTQREIGNFFCIRKRA